MRIRRMLEFRNLFSPMIQFPSLRTGWGQPPQVTDQLYSSPQTSTTCNFKVFEENIPESVKYPSQSSNKKSMFQNNFQI